MKVSMIKLFTLTAYDTRRTQGKLPKYTCLPVTSSLVLTSICCQFKLGMMLGEFSAIQILSETWFRELDIC
jgi:hypothetical protein